MRIIYAPKEIKLEPFSGFLVIDNREVSLEGVRNIDFIYCKKRMSLMVVNKVGEVVLNTKINYSCNKSIDEIKEITSDIKTASIYYR
ncbi:hypothetical protein CXF86_17735 [Shewanella sp. GutCb]|nr:hypothetical protein CXF86_17735 [Shewanella sp. GutCb]